MTTNRFEPLEPYNIDPEDRTTRGRLIHAAKRGDARARLTLRNFDRAAREAERDDAGEDDDAEHEEQQPTAGPDRSGTEDEPPPARPTVADGRRLRTQRRRGPAWDRQDEREHAGDDD